jgi:Tol biopolymer transport system component
MRSVHHALLVVTAIMLLAMAASPVTANSFGEWAPAKSLESLAGSSSAVNTDALDGCPIQAPDGLSLYMATTRPGGLGGIDIWVADRSSTDEGFGAPVNLGAPVNSAADDFCPTPVRGKGLFFVSRRAGACAANSADMYFARLNPALGWTTASHLGCTVNSTGDEFSPAYVEENGSGALYFSSNRGGNHDIYRSPELSDGSFAAPVAVDVLNTTSDEFRPNVRKDGREIVFDSNRAGGLGASDIYAATRSSVAQSWSVPSNLGPAINSAAGESRASLSWDGSTLLFGSAKPGGEGSSDIYVSFREKVAGS